MKRYVTVVAAVAVLGFGIGLARGETAAPGTEGYGDMVVTYNANTGELSFDVPEGETISSLSVRSAGNYLTGDSAPDFMKQDTLFSADDDMEIFSGLVTLNIDEDFTLGTVVGVPGPSDPFADFTFEYNGIELATMEVVPEPATFCLLSLGGLALIRRKNR